MHGEEHRHNSIAGDGSDYTEEEVRFAMAWAEEKARLGVPTLTVRAVLRLVKRLGYRLTSETAGTPRAGTPAQCSP